MLTSDDEDGAKTNVLSLDTVSQAIIILERLEKGATTQEILDLAERQALFGRIFSFSSRWTGLNKKREEVNGILQNWEEITLHF